MRRDKPETYPNWLKRKLKQLELQNEACCLESRKKQERLDSLKSTGYNLSKGSWTRAVREIPGGLVIEITVMFDGRG
jgi:hypothetical protein